MYETKRIEKTQGKVSVFGRGIETTIEKHLFFDENGAAIAMDFIFNDYARPGSNV